MKRRVSVGQLQVGIIPLEPPQAHHIRDVLRLVTGAEVELFDAHGAVGQGVIIHCDHQQVLVRVDRIDLPPVQRVRLTIAAAIPKGARADWMVEKLSELGVDRLIPLRCDRSVVVPGGKGKAQRWVRLAGEAARQSRRRGVMQIEEFMTPAQLVDSQSAVNEKIGYCSTEAAADHAMTRSIPEMLTLMIGPEGGWSDAEISLFASRGVPACQLTETVLRVETAAVAAAVLVLCRP